MNPTSPSRSGAFATPPWLGPVADRLFFERALVMEGDTEMGLVLKNTLDAMGPLFR